MLAELINHIWQSTIFVVAAGMLALALRTNRAQVRYWMWFAASVKFLVPFALLMSLGSHLQWAPAKTISAAPAVAFEMVQIAEPFPETVTAMPSARATYDWISVTLVGVWVCGSFCIASIRFREWLRIRAAVHASAPIEISKHVEIRSAPGLLEPGVVGVFRPVLLLPDGIVEHLTPPQLEAVMAHELCHVRRRDNLFAAIHMIVEALFWFHPLVWWIGGRLVEERERACDEEVLRLGSEPRVYAEGIVNVCKLYVESPLACVSGVTGSDIKKRIEAIMTNRIVLKLNFAKKFALAVAGMVALAVPMIIGILNVTAIHAQSTTKFEVASIRLGCGGGGRGGDGKQKGGGAIPASSPGRLSVCASLAENMGGLIQQAYFRFANGHRNPPWAMMPVEGGPPWIRSDAYNINARAADNTSLEAMNGPMLQALLEDRFKLKMHRETREVPVYALTIAKGGPKLQAFKEGSCVPVNFANVPFIPPDMTQNNCNDLVRLFPPPNVSVEAHGANLEVITFLLGLTLDRPIVDKTGLMGLYDLHLDFGREGTTVGDMPPPPPGAPPSEPLGPAGPSIFTAIQEQLGLKLESTKGPRDFLVIDSVERPSEN